MFDYTLLKERMKELRFKQYDIAEATGKSRATISAALNGDREFTQSEIIKIAKLLQINDKEISRYFFYIKT